MPQPSQPDIPGPSTKLYPLRSSHASPQRARIQENCRNVVHDVLERKLVTRERQPIGKLPQQQQHHAGKHGDRHFDSNQQHHHNHPRERRFELQKTAPVVPPISTNRFFFQPSHIAENERYIRTRTAPSLYPNQSCARAAALSLPVRHLPALRHTPPRGRLPAGNNLAEPSRTARSPAAALDFGSFTCSKENFCASLTYTNGISAFSYHCSSTCSGENDTSAASCSPARSSAFWAAPASSTASASVKSNHSPEACCAPTQTA